MKKINKFLLSILCSSVANAQTPDVIITEDYTNPKEYMWQPTNEYRTGKIENGIYVSKAKKGNASLNFQYGISEKQNRKNYASDIEFEIVKLQGENSSYITVELEPFVSNKPLLKLQFNYNGLGEWNIRNGKTQEVYANGKAVVKEGSNLIKILHREKTAQFYLNNELLNEHQFEYSVEISWWFVLVGGNDKSVTVGLDKAVFKGYSYSTLLFEENAKKEQKEKEANFIVPPTFPEGKKSYNGTTIPVSFDYNAKWTLKDFENKSFLGNTGVELTVSKSETGGYFLVTTDTTSLTYEGYYKKYVDVNYFSNGVPHSYNTLKDAEALINGQKAKMREVITPDRAINPQGFLEFWCLIIKDKRYYMLYAVVDPSDRQSVLSSFNSFKIN